MKITLFLEGSPGHEKQTRAVVQALENMLEVESHTITLEKLSGWQRFLQFMRYLVYPDGGCSFDIRAADIVIGTGSRTHIPLLSCKKKYGIAAVTCMAPDKILLPRFDLCFVPRHDGLPASDTVFLTDGPPVLGGAGHLREDSHGLILIGGADEKSHRWNEDLLLQQLSQIGCSSPSVGWVVSSSPRTPDTTVNKVEKLASEHENITFFHYRDTAPGWVEQQYSLARYVWVTGDSMSMIYEAVTAGCTVGILPVEYRRADNKFKKSIDNLVAQRRVSIFNGNMLAYQGEGPSFNEAQRCAEELRKRFC